MKRVLSAFTLLLTTLIFQSCASAGDTKVPDATTPAAPVATAPKNTQETEVKSAMDDFVKAQTGKDGTIDLKVLQDGQRKTMKVRFVKILDPIALLSPASAIACTEFKDVKKGKRAKKLNSYDIDFWFAPGADGKLTILPEKTEIHTVNGKKLYDYDRTGNKIPVG